MCVISGEKNDNVNVEEKSGIVQVSFKQWFFFLDDINAFRKDFQEGVH